MKPTTTTLTTVLFILAAIAGPALGATIYVPADQPTIQAGIDAASDGDEVVVSYGVYVENVDFPDKAITLRGLQLFGNQPVIDGNQSGQPVVKFDSLVKEPVLDGFKITNGYSALGTWGNGGGIATFGSSPTIMNCIITENSADGFGGGIACEVISEPTIMNCTISNNTAIEGGGIYFSVDAIITNCVISENTAEGYVIPPEERGGGIYIWHCSPTIKNCLIAANESWDGPGIYSYYSSPTIQNCTISDNWAGSPNSGIASEESDWTVTNCIIWGNNCHPPWSYLGCFETSKLGGVTFSDIGGDGFWGGLGNISENPLFVGGGDYHLASGSPCIDAGHASSLYDDDCFPPSLGTTRNDMGAYGGPLGCDWIPCPDADGDGFHDQACGGTDCDDSDPDMHPDAAETCGNGIDDDCDGLIDSEDPECQDCPLAAGTWLLDLSWEKSTVIATFHLSPFATVEYSSGVSGTWSWAGCSVEWSIESMGMFTEYWGVMDPGGQTMEGEMVSPYGTAGTWSAMRMELTFDLAASYESGLLSLDFSLGTPEPSVWSTYLVLTSPTITVFPIWTISLPMIYPPLDVPISFPIPGMGWVGVYTTVTLDSGEETYDLEWVDTGW